MKTILFFLLFCLIGCSSEEKPEPPKNLIEKDKMTLIMEEMLRLESYYQRTFGMPSIYKEPLKLAGENVFKKYGVSAKSYEDSYRYYAQQYDIFLEMNQTIIERQNKSLLDLSK